MSMAYFVAGLAAYAFCCRWLASRQRTGVLGFAERVRRAVAYEGANHVD